MAKKALGSKDMRRQQALRACISLHMHGWATNPCIGHARQLVQKSQLVYVGQCVRDLYAGSVCKSHVAHKTRHTHEISLPHREVCENSLHASRKSWQLARSLFPWVFAYDFDVDLFKTLAANRHQLDKIQHMEN